jgi:hypothetical protein
MNAIMNALKGRSWTMNFNALGIALFVLDVFMGTDLVKSNPDTAILLGAIGNILLRFKTNSSVGSK